MTTTTKKVNQVFVCAYILFIKGKPMLWIKHPQMKEIKGNFIFSFFEISIAYKSKHASFMLSLFNHVLSSYSLQSKFW